MVEIRMRDDKRGKRPDSKCTQHRCHDPFARVGLANLRPRVEERIAVTCAHDDGAALPYIKRDEPPIAFLRAWWLPRERRNDKAPSGPACRHPWRLQRPGHPKHCDQ